MTSEEKRQILSKISDILNDYVDENNNDNGVETVELLTIKECVELVPALSERSVRHLVASGVIPSVRTKGQSGKILVNKNALLKYVRK